MILHFPTKSQMPIENLKREHRRHERALARVLVTFITGQQRRRFPVIGICQRMNG
jgi:hypothetical protein